VRDLAMGPYKGKETGETALFRTLWGGLEPGEIALGDRYFASYFGIAGLSQRGVDGLFRMHQRREFDFRRGRRLGIEDHVVTWTKPERPGWMDEETYAQVPGELAVRELRITVRQPGFRVNELVLVTTLIDAVEYPKEDVAALFLERWNIEICQADCTSRLRLFASARSPHSGRGGVAGAGPVGPTTPATGPGATAMRSDTDRAVPPRPHPARVAVSG
jgi:hypothetical protein